MDHLLDSRISKEASNTKLENLSPDKYGKAAYAGLSFTPSKLVDNVLYKEATNFKKIEEQSSKVREYESTISILKDRLKQLQEQFEGIQTTLTQQVMMYKKMLNENELRHQQRVKDIQKLFSEQMQKMAASKEEEAKYAQSEKQLLECQIEELEKKIGHLTDRLDHGGSNFDTLSREHEKLEIHHKNTCQKLADTEKKLQAQKERAKNQYEQLSRKMYNSEVDFKGQVEKLQLEREKEKQTIERLHRVELEKVQNKRVQESQQKNQELKQLNETFNAQLGRMNETIHSKQKNIEHLNDCLNEEKEKFLRLTRESTSEITNLVHEKNRLKEDVTNLQTELTLTREERRKFQASTDQTITSLESVISNLKDELQLSQINYVREKDRAALNIDDLHREILALKSENDRVRLLASENNVLCKEVRNLKDLLLESSLELERCKDQFVLIGREKDNLAMKVRELGFENETLHRITFEKEEEVRNWRDSYYLNRR